MVNYVDVALQYDGDVALHCLLRDLLIGTLTFHLFLIKYLVHTVIL